MTPKPVTRKPGSMPRIRTVGAGIRGLFRIEDQGSRIKEKNAGRARLGAPAGGTAALEVPHPLRQELMNLLRSSPFRFLRLACLLHSPARSCLTCRLALATVLLPSRHALMNFLRASPFSFFSPACLLQALMRSCCFFWA